MIELNLPYDTGLEQHIIGCMIYDPECIVDIADIVSPEHFYWKKHQLLCRKIIDLWNEDEKQVSLTILSPFLEKHEISISEITDVVTSIASTASVRAHAEKLRDMAILRETIRIGFELTELSVLKDQDDIKEAIQDSQSKLEKIAEMNVNIDTIKPMSEAVKEFHEQFEQIYQNQVDVTGIPTGFDELDVYTSGFQPSDLIIIAGRPSMGKTAFALQIAEYISNREQRPTALFSLEMDKKPMIRRMIANVARIDLQKLNNGMISDEEYQKYTKAIGYLSRANLVIDDQAGMTVNDIKAKARRIKRERGLDCIIIDYLGLIEGERGQNTYERVSKNSRMLKQLAKDFNVPVIVLAQLSRAVEQRQDKRPVLSDLRESGQVEQDADLVMFLYRDDYYNKDSDKKNITEVIIAKQRNGPVGRIELAFLKEYNLFAPLERRMEL